jgi:UDP-N-acetylmuramate dehydrogenase
MDLIDKVEGYLVENGQKVTLNAKECRFSYRNSIFKNELKNKVIITHVSFRLQKVHQYHTSYPDLKKEMDQFEDTTIQTIRQAIIKIRKYKLPDPAETGNAGSFFKNPIIQEDHAARLEQFFPGIPVYRLRDGSVKLSAAWLIDQSGWKGKTYRNAGTHRKQPLILINRGGATGEEILQCALRIQKAVMNHFAIRLEMEVNVL